MHFVLAGGLVHRSAFVFGHIQHNTESDFNLWIFLNVWNSCSVEVQTMFVEVQ